MERVEADRDQYGVVFVSRCFCSLSLQARQQKEEKNERREGEGEDESTGCVNIVALFRYKHSFADCKVTPMTHHVNMHTYTHRCSTGRCCLVQYLFPSGFSFCMLDIHQVSVAISMFDNI